MTSQDAKEIDRWFETVQKAQPKGTLALLFYVRDGKVHLGRGNEPLEMKNFPTANFAQVLELAYQGVEIVQSRLERKA